jgi:transposase InsO family protein
VVEATGYDIEEVDRENAASAAKLLERAIWAEGRIIKPVVLHADNGSPMKGATMKVTMGCLGVTASFSRPRVSNDNPFSEALFQTCKYVPDYPTNGFATLEEARLWVQDFVALYNATARSAS